MAFYLNSILLGVFLALPLVCGELELKQRDGVIQGAGNTVGYGTVEEEWRGEVIHLSWSPRLYLLKNFLTDEECDHFIELSESNLRRSMLVDSKTGKPVVNSGRTSEGAGIARNRDPVVTRIQDRVARVTMFPKTHQETIQVLRYKNGQYYKPHFDFLNSEEYINDYVGGQRVVTVLMYLSTPKAGGETVFPRAERNVSGSGWSDCAKQGYAVKAGKGDAVMFYNLRPDGGPDPTSLHGSCPTIAGEKWSATIWVHGGPHRVGSIIPNFLLETSKLLGGN